MDGRDTQMFVSGSSRTSRRFPVGSFGLAPTLAGRSAANTPIAAIGRMKTKAGTGPLIIPRPGIAMMTPIVCLLRLGLFVFTWSVKTTVAIPVAKSE